MKASCRVARAARLFSFPECAGRGHRGIFEVCGCLPPRGISGKLLAACAAALQLALLIPAACAENAPACVRGEILVKMRGGKMLRAEGALAPDIGVLEVKETADSGVMRVAVDEGVSEEEAARALASSASDVVEYAEPNYLVRVDRIPTDQRFGELYALRNTGQTGGRAGADIDATHAWDIQTGGDVAVAVVDSGVDCNHQDLSANVWINEGEIPGNGLDDDGNGYVDDWRGWDFRNRDSDPADDHSHGTHVAGTIAAIGDNGVGVAGVAWHAKIMPVKFIGAEGFGNIADAASAIRYAARMGAAVVNASWGTPAFTRTLEDAIQEAENAGVIIAAAAGNTATDNDLAPYYPAGSSCGNVIAVAATDAADQLASFSCYGFHSVEIAAPGVSILSTVPGGGYGFKSGTSMAAPHVAGAVALAWAHAPGKSPAQIIDDIIDGATPLSSLNGKVASGGRLNLRQLLDPQNDRTPPSAVTDLAVDESGMSHVTLRWTASGDDGSAGTASAYDLRYSLSPITASNWEGALRCASAPAPKLAGSGEETTVCGLLPETTYYFALRVQDDRGNSSVVSECASAATSAGVTVFSDGAESGGGWTATGLWHRTGHRAASGASSWYYGREGTWTYDTGDSNSGTLTSADINLKNYEDAVVVFNNYRQVEPGRGFCDVASLAASRDGGASWETIWRRDAAYPSSPLWECSGAVALSAYAHGAVRLRFSFDTMDALSNNYEGWYVDDIRVIAEDSVDYTQHRVGLMLNRKEFRRGEVLSLSAAVTFGPLCPYRVCDAYVWVTLPNGRAYYLRNNLSFAGSPAPLARSFHVMDLTIAIGDFAIPLDLAPGVYTWHAVLVQSGQSPTGQAGRASNIAAETVKVNF